MSQTKIPIADMVRQEGASPSLIKRLEGADKDKDGTLSLAEIVLLVREEQRAQADRKLFRNFLIALVVGMLILIAALCGTVYAIVKLSQEVGDDNGMLVSKSSGEVMFTGSVVQRVPNLADALLNDDTDVAKMLAMGMPRVLVPGQDGKSFSVNQVSSITVDAGTSAVIRLADGNQINLDDSSRSLNSTGGLRRSLKSGASQQPQGEVVTRCIFSRGWWDCASRIGCWDVYPDGRIEKYCVIDCGIFTQTKTACRMIINGEIPMG